MRLSTSLFIGFFLFLIISPVSKIAAQDSISNAEASAIVLWNLTVEGVQDLQFEEITMGEEKVINLDGTVDGLNPTGQEQPGKFKIITTQSFELEFKNLSTVMQGPGGDEMPIQFFAAWSEKKFPNVNELNMFDINRSLSMSSNQGIKEI